MNEISRLGVCVRVAQMALLVARAALVFVVRAAVMSVRNGRKSWRMAAGRSLTSLLQHLGPTFIKVGQFVASRRDWIASEVGDELRTLQDRVTPMRDDKVRQMLAAAYGNNPFESVDAVPFASASIAQVHLARLHDGRRAVLKIQRPNLRRIMQQDFAILRWGVSVLQRFQWFSSMPLHECLSEIECAVYRQLDFVQEAQVCDEFRRRFAESADVVVPQVYWELCRESIIAMEYLDGLIKVDDLAPRLSQEERRRAAVLLLRTLYRMMFVDGLVHCDMHQANVFFRASGGLILVDFGFVQRLRQSEIVDFAAFFFAIANNDSKECSRIIFETAIVPVKEENQKRFEADMIDLIAAFYARKACDFEVGEFAARLFDVQRRNHVHGTAAFTMTILALLVVQNLVKIIDPTVDFQAEARAFRCEILSRLVQARIAAAHAAAGVNAGCS